VRIYDHREEIKTAVLEIVGQHYQPPDPREKDLLWQALDAERNTGIWLTESKAMVPTAAVSGLYFPHPDSRYFAVGKLARDQVADYAERRACRYPRSSAGWRQIWRTRRSSKPNRPANTRASGDGFVLDDDLTSSLRVIGDVSNWRRWPPSTTNSHQGRSRLAELIGSQLCAYPDPLGFAVVVPDPSASVKRRTWVPGRRRSRDGGSIGVRAKPGRHAREGRIDHLSSCRRPELGAERGLRRRCPLTVACPAAEGCMIAFDT
jgi:hypothetical protein